MQFLSQKLIHAVLKLLLNQNMGVLEFSDRAEISPHTMKRFLEGKPINQFTFTKICKAANLAPECYI